MAENQIDKRFCSVGIDGCKGGWIVASICKGELKITRFSSINEIAETIPFDIALIDMIIGLPDKKHQSRPDAEARQFLKPKLKSSVFNAPCRRAVKAKTNEEQNKANCEELGKGLSPYTISIIRKICEVDEFLLEKKDYKNRIMESHPEVCFASFSGGDNLLSKKYVKGIMDRIKLLKKYLPVTLELITKETIKNKCNEDDVVDAICLAITANLFKQGKAQTIPSEPKQDAEGLPMQMIVPSFLSCKR